MNVWRGKFKEAVFQSRFGLDRRTGNKKIDGFEPSIFFRTFFKIFRFVFAGTDTSYPENGRR